jgi:NTP pyrophosphatase (non-canonical NTP hydrolase)
MSSFESLKISRFFQKIYLSVILLAALCASGIMGNMHISEFQQLISKKYEKRDSERGIPATFMWFVEEVGELATALVSKDDKNKEEEFADVFAWLCTLANISDVDLEKACKKYTRSKVKGFKPK